MKALIFDLDDTLYDQEEPFKRAVQLYLSVPDEQMEALYIAFRLHADEVFEAASTGEMTLEASHIYRMKEALADFGYAVSDELALTIQKEYQDNQGKLELSPEIPAIFDYCREKKIRLGIITNGPHLHQLRKLQALEMTNWISEDATIISGQVGIAKPSKAIFDLTAERLQLRPEDMCYVGDAFENDVVSAKGAGWQVIWLNHRKRQAPDSPYQADAVVEKRQNLLGVIQKLASR
ncbi:HAD family hydrolase [Streptococcus cuniculi]|uniref:HAD family hydrolase n=1 Tax=Streptococcus cuniculi TaxID=1432788 RepID=A0A4Y9JGC1_9STRE|nr:HAD family hydrolase [Streptococcus cuniculi]MBF0777303.1 HAD family hydrolase [Streptococcus cuniculi]TFU98905.1 HAD family hydrolase [Streptococcus cuniculi]